MKDLVFLTRDDCVDDALSALRLPHDMWVESVRNSR